MAVLPTEAAKRERTLSLVNESIYVVALQRRRLQTDEPEDRDFVMRLWADWEFFIIALSRLRRRASILRDQSEIASALAEFDRELPDLKLLRDVAEHIDEYAVDCPRRHEPSVSRREIQVGGVRCG